MWLLSLSLIVVGVLSFLMGLSHDGIEAPIPTATGGILSWGGLAAIACGLVLLLWNIIQAIRGLV